MSDTTSIPGAIYFDSNILIAAGWPLASPKFREVMGFAEALKIPLCLPELVRKELCNDWVRTLREKQAALQSGIGELNRKSVGLLNISAIAKLPEAAELIEGVIGKTAEFTEKFRLVPRTTRPTDEFIEMALRRGGAFGEGGKGFSDTVILCSVLDDMRAQKCVDGIFVSNDGGFRNPDVGKMAAEMGLTLKVFSNLDELASHLQGGLSAKITDFLGRERQRLLAVVIEHAPELTLFLNENLKLTKEDLRAYLLKSVVGLQVLAVGNAHKAWNWWKTESADEDNRISFDAKLLVRIVTENFDAEPPPPLKVGEMQPTAKATYDFLMGPKLVEEDREMVVTVDAEVDQKDGAYVKMSFTGVRAKQRYRTDFLGSAEPEPDEKFTPLVG